MSGFSWHAKEKAAHTRALDTPQAFPLSGDGEHVVGLLGADTRDGAMLGVHLAEARYRDWRSQGELFAPSKNRRRGATVPFRLTAGESAARPERRSQRLAEGPAIVRELLAILDDSGLGDACAVEMARAKAYLARERVSEMD